ncbi:transporter substrate-binding domain-containing protein [Pseudodesulfovibrio thermohalotolerans]|uniref:substrate-binding periplasmic protein n=1 Tax=Pseudodesulfovibrio thermohalotolerans TaxID=2880651 RepID=UPI002441F927|nr:transporter substrate-binding domain-containing protein [Pseudodesulfovibrio thermohalotolerans]WFS64331.1 transporter substrate-binding domain-containing protein [Pseudodesulfovibrio thermohalotolerans]
MTHDLAGQAYVDQDNWELRGIEHTGKRAFNLEVVREIMLAIGNKGRIREVSFAQGMQALTSRPDTVFFNVYRTPQREERFKWVGPLQREIDYLYGLRRNGPIGGLAEARQVPAICAVDGSQHHATLLELGFKNIVPVRTYLQCFAMLKEGSVTLAVSSEETLLRKLRQTELPASDIRRVSEPLLQSAGYIAFSPEVDDAVVRKWQAALNALISSGRFQELYERYY